MGSYRDIRDQRIKWKKRRKRDSLVAYPRKPQSLFVWLPGRASRSPESPLRSLGAKNHRMRLNEPKQGSQKTAKPCWGGRQYADVLGGGWDVEGNPTAQDPNPYILNPTP